MVGNARAKHAPVNNTYSSAVLVLVGGVCLIGFVGALTQSPSRISMDHSEPSSSVNTVLIPTRYWYGDKYFQNPGQTRTMRWWSSRDGVCSRSFHHRKVTRVEKPICSRKRDNSCERLCSDLLSLYYSEPQVRRGILSNIRSRGCPMPRTHFEIIICTDGLIYIRVARMDVGHDLLVPM